jgi:hypothetical protein
MKLPKITAPLSAGLVCGIVLAGSISVLNAAWTAPSGTPSEGNNAPAPLNVGPVGQIKDAGIALNATGVSASGLLVLNGDVGVGTLNPLARLDVAGKAVSESTADGDPGNTMVTKDYVDAQSGGGGNGYFYARTSSRTTSGTEMCASSGASCRCTGETVSTRNGYDGVFYCTGSCNVTPAEYNGSVNSMCY